MKRTAADLADSKRQLILEAAAAVLPARGIGNLRLLDVAREAGVSIGTLQHYFETRDKLVRETCRWVGWQRQERWASSADHETEPWQRLTILISHVFEDPLFGHRSILWLEFCAAASRDPELQQEMSLIYAAWRKPVLQAIVDGQKSGIFKSELPAPDVVDLIMLSMDGCETAMAAAAESMSPKRFSALILAQTRIVLGRNTPQ